MKIRVMSAMATLVVPLMAACSGGSETAATVTVTASSSTSDEVSPSTDPATAQTDITDSDSVTSEGQDTATDQTSDVVVPSNAAGQQLHLAQFFNPDTSVWSEGRYSVASKTNLMGIATDVSACGDSSSSGGLELRLGNRFKKLKFTVGQSQQSKSSQDTIVVDVLTDGNKVDSHAVHFNQTQAFDVSVKDVSAVIIKPHLDESVPNCGSNGPATLVLTEITVE